MDSLRPDPIESVASASYSSAYHITPTMQDTLLYPSMGFIEGVEIEPTLFDNL